MRCVLSVYGPHVVGGVGNRPNPSDHTTGRAVDITIADWDTPAGKAHGWQIARWVRDNARQLGVTYVIFDAEIWSVQRTAEGWRPYSHPTGASSPTLDHLNHVHVTQPEGAGLWVGDRGCDPRSVATLHAVRNAAMSGRSASPGRHSFTGPG
jgi:hypothetical protein